jgi:hypothetical protein
MNDIFTQDVPDEVLEQAAGLSAVNQAGASLYSTIDVSGCTCIG